MGNVRPDVSKIIEFSDHTFHFLKTFFRVYLFHMEKKEKYAAFYVGTNMVTQFPV